MNDFFQIGIIVGPHGLKGDIKILPTTDDIRRFEWLKKLVLQTTNKEMKEFEIEKLWYFKKFVMVKLKGIDEINQINDLKSARIIVPYEEGLPLEENQYYYKDLIGLKVITENGEELGKLADILSTGANDIYIIRKVGAKDLLIPAIKDCILQVDLDKNTMIVHLLEGLR